MAKSPDGKRKKIYPRVIKGRSQRIRIVVAGLIYGMFFLLPWLSLDGSPAIHFDLSNRQFHIFSTTFWPQDFMFLAWFLIIAAFSLFLFTTVAGRLWCGYACPQTIWTLAFVWIENKIEGAPHQRKRLDRAPASVSKFGKKFFKHILWFLLSIATGFSFVAYFYPAPQLIQDLYHLQAAPATWVWIAIFTYLTYIDAAWLREQVCIYMCPYARFQSVMYDEETLMVSYNPDVAEPRSTLKRATADSGNCIECNMCVQVCPTGIDIRDGVQISCINCGLCEDACADVMTSIGKPANLIAFTSLNANHKRSALKLFRPKVIAYCVILIIMTSLLAYNLLNRSILEASVIRDRDTIFTRTVDNKTANEYFIKLINKTPLRKNVKLHIQQAGFTLKADNNFYIDAGELFETSIQIISEDSGKGGIDLSIDVIDTDTNSVLKNIQTRFIYPP
jgi:cytochrome c oxidase accessory protein FixG